MKLIHKITEGEQMSNGINIMAGQKIGIPFIKIILFYCRHARGKQRGIKIRLYYTKYQIGFNIQILFYDPRYF